MIATLAAGLGANNTSAWLASAAGSVVIKVFVVDPIKVCLLTVFVQFAEDYTRDVLVKTRAAVADAETAIVTRVSVAMGNVPSRHRREP